MWLLVVADSVGHSKRCEFMVLPYGVKRKHTRNNACQSNIIKVVKGGEIEAKSGAQ